jgi:two-component system cell cycle response regulator
VSRPQSRPSPTPRRPTRERLCHHERVATRKTPDATKTPATPGREASSGKVPPRPTPPTVPSMPAVRIDSLPQPGSAPTGRDALMPPAPPDDAPQIAAAPSIVDADPESSVDDPLSSRLSFPSMVPEGMRDTSVTHTTDPDVLSESTTVRDRPLLLRMDGTEAGQVHTVTQDSVQIGRHPTTDIPVIDAGVSRIHARVFCVDGEYHIEDLGSRNGTFVEGARVEQSRLDDGQSVRLGPRVTFRFAVLDEKQERLLRQLYESSKRDALTGIFNRKHFEERLKSEIAYAQRHETLVGLVLFDLDHFKKVNDTYGHPGGDVVLRHVTAIVAQKLRAEDLFARVGGEEFAVLVRGSSLRQAVRVGERLRVAVATTPAHFESEQIPVSISVGCATTGCTGSFAEQALVELADQRLYRAKQTGRNRVVSTDG